MNLLEGTLFSFNCRFKSPFHTTEREYSNLLKCASFIPGTTLRGAILKSLIELNCSKISDLKKLDTYEEIKKFHLNCPEKCPVKTFFTESKPLTESKTNSIFSSGTFNQTKYNLFTRIGLTKDSKTAAEGMIVNAECISTGVPFNFDICLFEEAVETIDALKEAIDLTSENGIGRFKSIGFGRFEAKSGDENSIDDVVYQNVPSLEADTSKIQLKFKTPLIFKNSPEAFDSKNIGTSLSNFFITRYNDICLDKLAKPLNILSADMLWMPEFINRYSYEIGKRESKMSAKSGSQINLKFGNCNKETEDQLAIGSTFGIGLWNNCGFGLFDVNVK